MIFMFLRKKRENRANECLMFNLAPFSTSFGEPPIQNSFFLKEIDVGTIPIENSFEAVCECHTFENEVYYSNIL